MSFEQKAAFLGLEWAVVRARGAARISKRLESHTTHTVLIVAYGQIATNKKNLFSILMNKRLCRVYAWLEAQQTAAATKLLFLFKSSKQNFLLNACWVALRHYPTQLHFERFEFSVQLINGHCLIL
jgi:hypothetical protein